MFLYHMKCVSGHTCAVSCCPRRTCPVYVIRKTRIYFTPHFGVKTGTFGVRTGHIYIKICFHTVATKLFSHQSEPVSSFSDMTCPVHTSGVKHDTVNVSHHGGMKRNIFAYSHQYGVLYYSSPFPPFTLYHTLSGVHTNFCKFHTC